MSLDKLKRELENLAKELDNSVDISTKDLGKKSLKYMKQQYNDKNMKSHKGNINLHAYNKRYKKGFVISSGDDIVAVFNEFGTGITKTTNSLAKEAGYQYNMSSPKKGVIPDGAIQMYGREYCERVNTPNTWWYFKNGKWWWSIGAKAKNMYSSLVEELRANAGNHYRTSISQTIGKYNGGKL